MRGLWIAIGMVFASTSPAWVQAKANTLTECERQPRFELLFDGTLESFQANFFEYRNDGAAGIFYRSLLSGDHPIHTGVKYTLENSVTLGNRKIFAGSAYDLFPSIGNEYRPFSTGNWNRGASS